VIVCPRCSKENQDHYKFCLGCGAELPRDAAKKEFVARAATTDPPIAPPRVDRNLQFAATQQGDVSMAPVPAGASASGAAAASMPQAAPPAAKPAPAGQAVHSCPACGNPVPHDFKFCGTCGHRLTGGGATPAAAVEATPAAPAAPAAPAVSAPPAATAAEAPRGNLVLINPDGSEGASFQLTDGVTQIGRNTGRMFGGDAYLSPIHATFTFSADGCNVRDEQSLNGVYVRIARDVPVRLGSGDVFRIGQEIIRYEAIAPADMVDGVEAMGSPNPGLLGRLCLVIGRSTNGNAYTIASDGMHIGRERGDVIFPEDGYVSGLHCRIHHDGTSVVLTDVGSSNGTVMRVRGERKLLTGDLLLLGQQLFRLTF
jgi:pSer/pThr/pTyr-binding forkhead associated (FHA) protein